MRDVVVRYATAAVRVLALIVALGTVGLLASWCSGCGGPSQAILSAHVRAGRVIEAADSTLASEVEAASVRATAIAKDRARTLEERLAIYDARMSGYAELDRALEAARQAWLVADSTISAWESARDDASARRWALAAACMLEALVHTYRLARHIGVDLRLDDTLGTVRSLTGELCPARGAR